MIVRLLGGKHYRLDKLDMQILSRLLNNCRESDRQIGRELNVSGGAVRSRIQKMAGVGIIEDFVLKIEPQVLGYGVFYIAVAGRDINALIPQIELVGDLFVIVPCVGGISVCGIVVRDNIEQKMELAKSLMKEVKVLTSFDAISEYDVSNLTRTDLEIIAVLMKDPRMSIEKISKASRLSTKTVARTIDKIQKDQFMQFTLVYEPTKLEGYIPYAILTQVQGGIDNMLKRLRSKFSAAFLQTPFLTKDQIVLFMYSDNIFKLDDMIQMIREIEGVGSAELFIPKKIVFPQKWINDSIKSLQKSPTLHLTQTH